MEDVAAGRDHGEVKPDDYGRWHWPFREMEVWDFFTVDLTRRSLAQIKAMAASRGTQLGRRFKVKQTGTNTVVVRRMGIDPALAPHKVRAIVDGAYGEGTFDSFKIENIGDEPAKLARPCEGKVPGCLVLDHWGTYFGLRFERDGFWIERVTGKTYDWLAIHQLVE